MGPIALFDKSFLQSLSVDESVWFDHFLYPTISPLFYVETLADLTKSTGPSGRTAEDEVRIIANKTPVLSGGPCVHHKELCLQNLMGRPVPMNGQIPMAGGRPVRAPDGKRGVVFDEAPEAQAFTRWQHSEFREIERRFAASWRHMLTTLDLPAVADRMRKLGISSKDCKSVEEAHAIAVGLVHQREKPFEQMALLFAFLDVPAHMQRPIIERWGIDQFRPLADYAPYAAHVLVVELFFQIALAANLISAERASNRVDIAYLCYLPFCMIFVSGDKLHRKCAPVFLRKDQEFVWGPDLKAELGRVDKVFSELPPEQLERGLMRFAPVPIGGPSDLLIGLWDRHTPGWRRKIDNKATVPMEPEAEKRLVERLKQFTSGPTDDSAITADADELDQMAIQRFVPKQKGKWWLLPKDLKVDEEGGAL
jgi:hypothetical protein